MRADEIEHAFTPGEHVEALDGTRRWVPARILRREPYQGRPGYYVAYTDAVEMWHCHGGWQPEQCIRQPSVKDAPPPPR